VVRLTVATVPIATILTSDHLMLQRQF